MKLSLVFFVALSLNVTANGFAQKITLSKKNAPIEHIFNEVKRQTDFTFVYTEQLLKEAKNVTINIRNASLEEALNLCFRDQPLTYTIVNKIVVIKEKKLRPENIATHSPPTVDVKGRVTDDTGEPLPGVSVKLKGSAPSATTDVNGNYSINLSESNGTLVFTYVGFSTQEVPINGRTNINVQLATELTALNEVVVVGYGTQKRINLTGAVAAIDGDKLAERPVSNVSQALQGMSPGTTIINRGGAPGADGAAISIRGIGTFGNNDPLIILDGVTITNMDNIDPQDIENISILKDAASAAIYGSRAANGVILITTKRGKNKPVEVSYSGYAGLQSLTRVPEWVSTEDYMRLVNEAAVNADKQPKFSEEAIQKTLAGTDPYEYPNTDWWGLLFRNALQQKHTLSISGGSEKIKNAISLFYLDKEGTLINTSSNQFGLRANSDIVLHENLDFNVDLSLNKRNRTAPAKINDIYWNLLHDVPPTVVAKYPDGTYQLGPTNRNPLAAAEQSGYEDYANYQGIISTALTWRPITGFKLMGRVSARENFEDGKRYNNEYIFKDYFTQATVFSWKNSLDQWAPKEDYLNFQSTADYEKTIGKHFFHALLGYSQEQDKWRDLTGGRTDFYSNDLQELNVGSNEGQVNSGTSTEWALRSVFGRLNYSFSDKYLLEANFRYDGSSRFDKSRRWGLFPSFSAGYRISEESFWEPIKNSISEFKIRGSWGQLGNQDIGLYQYIQTISLGQNYSFGGQLASGAAETTLANPLISWETATATNIGFDAALFKNRMTITADFYNRITDDILLIRDIPRTAGLGAPTQNVGSVQNTGWEVAVDYNNRIGKDFQYHFGLNASDVKNKILKYGEASVDGWYITKEGESMNSLYGYVTEGLFQTEEEVANHAFQNTGTGPGDIVYKDMNDDDIINDLDKVVLGSTIPRYNYGITLGGKYKNFDVNLFFNGVGKAVGYQEGALIEGPIWDGFTTKEVLDRWTPENPDATWPRLVYQTIHNEQPSDRWIQNTSFFRLKNFQLGYSIPEDWLKAIHIKSFRGYISGENVLTLTKARNLDPEFPSGRANYYPQTKIYTLGVNVTF